MSESAPVRVVVACDVFSCSSYLSKREWGKPRQAVGADAWGLSWRGAIDDRAFRENIPNHSYQRRAALINRRAR